MIIGIHGYSGSGKDTVGQMIIDNQPSKNWKVKKFAGKLKDIASMLTGIPVEKFEDQDFKKTDLGKEWNYAYPGEYYDNGSPVMVTMSVRQLLQNLGTDAMREGLHQNVWVNALMADYIPLPGTHIRITEDGFEEWEEGGFPNWVITDCRFPNEADAIKKAGGFVISVSRPGVGPINDHPSETGLDGYPFDFTIYNSGSIAQLNMLVKDVMNKISAVGDANARETLLVENMCMSYRHDFGLMSQEDKQNLRFECREWLRAYRNNILP
jgi:hypothetical protein